MYCGCFPPPSTSEPGCGGHDWQGEVKKLIARTLILGARGSQIWDLGKFEMVELVYKSEGINFS